MTKQTKSRGFTIVELLIVIVIIAILAAITIVAYNGITARANTSSAKAAAGNTLKKAEAYNADSPAQTYPKTFAALTGAAATTTYQLTGVTFTTTRATGTTAPSSPNVLNFFICTTGSAVEYFDYSAKAWTAQYTGGATGIGGAGTADCAYQAS